MPTIVERSSSVAARVHGGGRLGLVATGDEERLQSAGRARGALGLDRGARAVRLFFGVTPRQSVRGPSKNHEAICATGSRSSTAVTTRQPAGRSERSANSSAAEYEPRL